MVGEFRKLTHAHTNENPLIPIGATGYPRKQWISLVTQSCMCPQERSSCQSCIRDTPTQNSHVPDNGQRFGGNTHDHLGILLGSQTRMAQAHINKPIETIMRHTPPALTMRHQSMLVCSRCSATLRKRYMQSNSIAAQLMSWLPVLPISFSHDHFWLADWNGSMSSEILDTPPLVIFSYCRASQ